MQPDFPPVATPSIAVTLVEVAIKPDGTLWDEWVWGPSGVPELDQESMKAARLSTYTGARAYCQAVPSVYFFRVMFLRNG